MRILACGIAVIRTGSRTIANVWLLRVASRQGRGEVDGGESQELKMHLRGLVSICSSERVISLVVVEAILLDGDGIFGH